MDIDINKLALQKHAEWRGKIEITTRVPLQTREDLSLAYTPGVAAPCLAIQADPDLSYTYTRRGNLVAVITDGSAVLGLGDIGGLAGMPVMEGKCALFKAFAGIDAVPLCVNTRDVSEFVRTVELIADSFGGINLEDIAAPRCFEIEEQLKSKLSIPVFHDDQHGTAIVVAAALKNALLCAGKTIETANIVINGAGSAGIAICKLLLSFGANNIVMVDKNGALSRDVATENPAHNAVAAVTNYSCLKGGLADVLKGADVFIGVSGPRLLTPEMIKSMAEKPIVFAMANPEPEIMPDIARAAGAFIVGTGRSDFPNQINNLLAFPGVFKGALQIRAGRITEEMKRAAATAIAGLIPRGALSPDNIIPGALDKNVAIAVAEAVAKAGSEKQGDSKI